MCRRCRDLGLRLWSRFRWRWGEGWARSNHAVRGIFLFAATVRVDNARSKVGEREDSVKRSDCLAGLVVMVMMAAAQMAAAQMPGMPQMPACRRLLRCRSRVRVRCRCPALYLRRRRGMVGTTFRRGRPGYWVRVVVFLGGGVRREILTKHASISSNGVYLNLTNESGSTSIGNMQGPNRIEAQEWQFVVGTLSNDGQQINWSNGTFWARCPSGGAEGVRT